MQVEHSNFIKLWKIMAILFKSSPAKKMQGKLEPLPKLSRKIKNLTLEKHIWKFSRFLAILEVMCFIICLKKKVVLRMTPLRNQKKWRQLKGKPLESLSNLNVCSLETHFSKELSDVSLKETLKKCMKTFLKLTKASKKTAVFITVISTHFKQLNGVSVLNPITKKWRSWLNNFRLKKKMKYALYLQILKLRKK